MGHRVFSIRYKDERGSWKNMKIKNALRKKSFEGKEGM